MRLRRSLNITVGKAIRQDDKTKKKQTQRYREQNSGYQWGVERKGARQEQGKKRHKKYKINKLQRYTYCTAQGIGPLFYDFKQYNL